MPIEKNLYPNAKPETLDALAKILINWDLNTQINFSKPSTYPTNAGEHERIVEPLKQILKKSNGQLYLNYPTEKHNYKDLRTIASRLSTLIEAGWIIPGEDIKRIRVPYRDNKTADHNLRKAYIKYTTQGFSIKNLAIDTLGGTIIGGVMGGCLLLIFSSPTIGPAALLAVLCFSSAVVAAIINVTINLGMPYLDIIRNRAEMKINHYRVLPYDYTPSSCSMSSQKKEEALSSNTLNNPSDNPMIMQEEQETLLTQSDTLRLSNSTKQEEVKTIKDNNEHSLPIPE